MTKCDTCKKRRRCINAYVAEPEIMNGCVDYVQRTNRDMPYSPWGPIEHQESIVRGVRIIRASRSGGVMVTESAAKKYLSKAAIVRGFCWGKYLCYERNVDAPIVLKELIEKGAWTAPVNDRWKSGEYEAKLNKILEQHHADYLKERRK